MRRRAEAGFCDGVIELATMAGWLVHHDRDDMRKHTQGRPGFPDLVLIRPPKLILAELKAAPGIELDRDQLVWMAGLRAIQAQLERFHDLDAPTAAMLEVHLWTPADWPVIQRVLAGPR